MPASIAQVVVTGPVRSVAVNETFPLGATVAAFAGALIVIVGPVVSIVYVRVTVGDVCAPFTA